MSIQKQLIEEFGEALKPLGFRRRGTSWFRTTGEVYAIINVQKSRYDESCFVNFGFSLGVSTADEWLPENKCQVRFRLESLKSMDMSGLRLLDASGGTDADSGWTELVSKRIIMPTADLMRAAQTVGGLREVLTRQLSPRIFVHRDAKRALLE